MWFLTIVLVKNKGDTVLWITFHCTLFSMHKCNSLGKCHQLYSKSSPFLICYSDGQWVPERESFFPRLVKKKYIWPQESLRKEYRALVGTTGSSSCLVWGLTLSHKISWAVCHQSHKLWQCQLRPLCSSLAVFMQVSSVLCDSSFSSVRWGILASPSSVGFY